MRSLWDQLRLLPSALLALTISHALAAATPAKNGESKTAAPLSIPPSQQWDGIDGSWSSFSVRIGTPAQDVRTFVSWNGYQTWAVIPQGCDAAESYDACAQTRGGIFNQSASTTWDYDGLYSLYILEDMGYYGNGYYGFDVVGLGPDTVTLQNTTVAGFALEDFYLGVLGINPKPTNFTSYSDGAPSYMTLLKEQGHIPSISFGYTAGAEYRSNSTSDAYGSLTLGGFDKTKFVANELTWDFAADNSRDIVVALQSVNTPSTIESSPIATEMLPNPIYIYLDATVPQIWLPIESCYVFEYEFGLVYDNTTELYLVNNTLHQTLLSRNASITFQLAIGENGGNVANIELPYAAFDLTAKAPYQGLQNDTYYFPLRRAMNESQYTLGRAFFQEAYVAVDYESQKFNVSQRVWQDSSSQQIVTIPPFTAKSSNAYPGVNSSQNSGSHSLSGGAIAGIVVGILAVLALIAVLLMWLFRRRNRVPLDDDKLVAGSDTGSEHDGSTPGRSGGNESIVIPKAELPGSEPPTLDPDDHAHLASGALSSNGSSSPSDVRTPRTPNALSGQTFVHGAWYGEGSSPSTETAEEGTGTHSSADSTSRGTGSHYGTGSGTLQSLVSPLSPTDSHEADSKEKTPVPELAGDMPTVKEKYGHELSEKEAMAHREKVYNGVETPVSPLESRAMTGREAPRKMVSGDEVVRANTLAGMGGVGGGEGGQGRTRMHRAFSFEGAPNEESSEELYK